MHTVADVRNAGGFDHTGAPLIFLADTYDPDDREFRVFPVHSWE